MERNHFAKTPAGACLCFTLSGYDEALFKAFQAAIESDSGLTDKERSKARAAMAPTSKWMQLRLASEEILKSFGMGQGARTLRGLVCASEARPASAAAMAIDGAQVTEHDALARDFHANRPWLNQLAKERCWLLDGEPMRFDPVFSHALSLSKGMRLEDASPTGIMGSQQAFALFSPSSGGYMEVRNSSSMQLDAPIGRSKIFESAKAAKAFASRKGLSGSVSVVEVLIRAVRPHTLIDNADHTPLMAAIAAGEAAELEEIFRAQELSNLRSKLSELEAADAESKRERRRGAL